MAKRHRHHKRRHSFHRRHGHHVSNPFKLPSLGGLKHDIVPAAVGGAGAVGLDILLAYVPLPAFLQTGMGNAVAKIGGSLAMGWLAGMAVGKRNGQLVTLGALTVSLYTVIRGLAQQTIGANVKGLSGLADFKDYSRHAGVGAYMQPRLGAYMNPGAMLRPGGMIVAAPPTTPGGLMRTKQMGAYLRGSRVGGAFASGY